MQATEANFDGLVGPTHNYAGLAVGNLASQSHQAQASNPREAALQGLADLAVDSQIRVLAGGVGNHMDEAAVGDHHRTVG